MSNELVIRNMTRSEVDDLIGWAAREGWNPGLHDGELFWATDPAAFIAADLDGELIGSGAITCYNGEFGFMGLFIVRPEYRGRGLGNTLWHARRERLLARLPPGAGIGLDGVFAMQSFYAKGGFVFSIATSVFVPTSRCVRQPRRLTPKESSHSPPFRWSKFLITTALASPSCERPSLRGWISQPDALALGCQRDGKLSGYGVVRRCREGCKIGPCSLMTPWRPKPFICTWQNLPRAVRCFSMPRRTTPPRSSS